MADNRWNDRDREWREDRSWGEGRGRGARGRGGGQGYYGAADRGEERWREMHRDQRREGPAGYNVSGPVQGGWEFGEQAQGAYRGQGYERSGYGRFEGQRYAEPGRGYYDEFGRDPGRGEGYAGEREYGRGGGYGAGSSRYTTQGYGAQTGPYAGQGGYGLSAQGEYGGGAAPSRYAYGAHTPYGYRGGNEYDERGRGGEYADDDRREHESRSWLERAGERVSAFFTGDEEGRYRGRGPRGYRRSDERIREDISDRLTDDPWLDASGIEVEVRECEVMLKGAVHSREDKRRAENLAETISGVRNVQNLLRIEDGVETGTTTAQPTTTQASGRSAAQDRDVKGLGSSTSRQAAAD